MGSRKNEVKFVDETTQTIKRSNGIRPKRYKLPGTSKIWFSRQKKKGKEPETSHLLSQSVLEQELAELLRPATSYGLHGLDESPGDSNFNFSDSFSDESPKTDMLRKGTVNINTTGIPPLGPHEINAFAPYEDQNEIKLIMHYGLVMTNFYTVKDPEWNIYSYIGTRMMSRYAPLKYAVLAWSALHLSLLQKTSTIVAQEYYDISLQAVMHHNFLEGDIPMEMLLITSFFLLQFDVMIGTKYSNRILRHVWSKLRIGQFFGKNGADGGTVQNLSPIGYQVLTWLLFIDIRAALFSGNICFPDYIMSESETRNRNIEYLSTSKVYDSQAVSNIFLRTRKLMSSAFGDCYPESFHEEDELMDNLLIIMVRNMMMFGRLIRLRNWLNQCGNSIEFDPKSLEKEIDHLFLDNQQILGVSDNYNARIQVLIENALIYAVIIVFDRICNPSIRTNEKCQNAASEILKIAIQLKQMRQIDAPQSLNWPFPLFIAGVETTDVIYQTWIQEELKQNIQAGWGRNTEKMLSLLNACINRQDSEKRRVAIGEVMKATTGIFTL